MSGLLRKGNQNHLHKSATTNYFMSLCISLSSKKIQYKGMHRMEIKCSKGLMDDWQKFSLHRVDLFLIQDSDFYN